MIYGGEFMFLWSVSRQWLVIIPLMLINSGLDVSLLKFNDSHFYFMKGEVHRLLQLHTPYDIDALSNHQVHTHGPHIRVNRPFPSIHIIVKMGCTNVKTDSTPPTDLIPTPYP